MWRALRFVVVVAISAIAFDSGAAPPPAVPGPPEPTQLAVLLNYASTELPRAEEVVSLIMSGSGPGNGADRRAAVLERLGNPGSAHTLISNRLAQTARDLLSDEDPEELLHRYIVLEFPTASAMRAAEARLQKDPAVVFVEEGKSATFAAIPSDPNYANTGGAVTNWQWGINNPLNLQAAWNTVRGTAYLGHIDNGIRVVHEDLGQPYRRFNFNVAGGTDVDEHPELLVRPGYPTGFAGHGSNTAGIMAAATSQTSVPAGYPNPSPAVGGAGVCWFCNLMIAKVSRIVTGTDGYPTINIDSTSDVPNAINWAVNSGVQVLNLSFEGPDPNCTTNPNAAYCLALAFAAKRQVVVVAAAGNSNKTTGGDGLHVSTTVAFPASATNSIAVGAIQSYVGATRGNLWTEETAQVGFAGSSTGTAMTAHGILAPGRDVLSSMYPSHDWNTALRCGVSQGTRGPNYGPCTGTSMAAPHITGIVGLMRSVNPLLDALTIRTKLLASGDNAASPSTDRGFGVANAGTAVSNVLATNTNRLTPLFALYNSGAGDHFYTVVPQQGNAAIFGTQIPNAGGTLYLTGQGNKLNDYANWPDPPSNPLARYPLPSASVWVFSTFQNPFNSSVELMPLYRASWKCGDPGSSPVCPTNPNHISHVYSASLSEIQSFIGAGYSFDGIEGYVLPVSQSQPAGTTTLKRAYNASLDDYELYPLEEQALAQANGYTQAVTTVGYAFYNTGPKPTY